MTKKSVSAVIVTYINRKGPFVDCINSLLHLSYPLKEIVVVDNASEIPVSSFIKRTPKIKIVRNKTNLGAAAGRNVGINATSGEFILFMDDDAIADRKMVKYLLEVFNKKKKVGVVQPKILDKEDPTLIQGVGHDINLLTGRVKAWGVDVKDNGQYDRIHKIPMVGGICLVKREVLQKVGIFDEEYFIPYEDSDLSYRIGRAGYGVYCYGKAKSWHHGKNKVLIDPRMLLLGITTPERAYRVARNKIIFMRKHAPFVNLLVFLFMFIPTYAFLHSLIILSMGRMDILEYYWRGLLSGLSYALASKPVTETL